MEETETPRHLVKFKDEYYSCERSFTPVIATDNSAPLRIDVCFTKMIPLTDAEVSKHTGPVLVFDETP